MQDPYHQNVKKKCVYTYTLFCFEAQGVTFIYFISAEYRDDSDEKIVLFLVTANQ